MDLIENETNMPPLPCDSPIRAHLGCARLIIARPISGGIGHNAMRLIAGEIEDFRAGTHVRAPKGLSRNQLNST